MFDILQFITDVCWNYIGIALIVCSGIYFSVKTKFFQFKVLRSAKQIVLSSLKKEEDHHGIHPLKLYFASIGGSIGVGNITVASLAVTLGGPGCVFWLWVASFCGMLVKYGEIFLGIKYRVKHKKEYDGGAMYFLCEAFHSKIPSMISAVLLCIYSIEVFQFTTITNVVSQTYHINYLVALAVMLVLVFYSAIGGITRLSSICTVLMPLFLGLYILFCCVVIIINANQLPSIFQTIIKSAFTGHAALGGFVGSSLINTMRQGVQTAVYSGDIGMGYDAIIQSATSMKDPTKQARLAILSLFSDTFTCFLTMMIVLVSGLWTQGHNGSQLVTQVLMKYFPHADYVMALLIFLAGFTTVIAYLTTGYKSARFLSHKYGYIVFTFFAFIGFTLFGFSGDERIAYITMGITGGLLMCLNISGIISLRNKIEFR